jgi:hypothetical protein
LQKIDNQLIINEHQQLTMYIKHLADSANFKGIAFNKHCNDLTGLLSEMPNVSYTFPLPPSEKNSISDS